MKRIFSIVTVIAAACAFVSCASADKMAKMADQVIVNCNPSPLALKGGVIPADLTVTYPADYFNAKAILEVTPVLVCEDGEQALSPIMYQGEKVQNNYTVVPSAGSTVQKALVFNYKEGIVVCHLELRARCTVNNGKKWITLPTKKVAEGLVLTANLVSKKGCYKVKDHGYQEIINRTNEGQVLYTINSAVVSKKEIKGQSVKNFNENLKASEANERETIKNIEVVAYASPDGPEAQNVKLSENRSKTAKAAFDKVTKGDAKVKDIETVVKSIGEDWEGFKTLVANSNIADKDLIIRVLGMYDDPAVREKEIRNMSSVFQELASDVLPQLRRARFIANIEFKNYTEAELVQLIKEDSDILDETALLKAATLVKDPAAKKTLYNKAVEKFGSEKAKFNLVCVALDEDALEEAKTLVANCDANDPEVTNLKGVIALREGRLVDAEKLFTESNTEAANHNLGTIAIIKGDYATAVAKCGDKGTNAALAKLLNGDNAGAIACVDNCKCCKCQCAKGQYIKAIALTRQGKIEDAKAALKKATEAKAELAERAKTDIEFATLK